MMLRKRMLFGFGVRDAAIPAPNADHVSPWMGLAFAIERCINWPLEKWAIHRPTKA